MAITVNQLHMDLGDALQNFSPPYSLRKWICNKDPIPTLECLLSRGRIEYLLDQKCALSTVLVSELA